jgi:hypothetical protein
MRQSTFMIDDEYFKSHLSYFPSFRLESETQKEYNKYFFIKEIHNRKKHSFLSCSTGKIRYKFFYYNIIHSATHRRKKLWDEN